MRRFLLGVTASWLLAGCGDPAKNGPVLEDIPFAPIGPGEFAEHPRLKIRLGSRHLLVMFKDGRDDAAIRGAVARADVALTGLDRAIGLATVQIAAGAGFERLEAAFKALSDDPAVASVSYDLPTGPTWAPPPLGGTVDNIDWNWATSGSRNWGLKAIGAPSAWNLLPALRWLHAREGRRVVVGVIDQWFAAHPDVAGVLTTDASHNPTHVARTDLFHGSFVAGIIGALWNGYYTDGIVPQPLVQLHGVASAQEGDAPDNWVESVGAEIIAATRLIERQRPRVVNLSLGFNWSSVCFQEGLCDPRERGRVDYATDCDDVEVRFVILQSARLWRDYTASVNRVRPVLFVVAAGNDSGRVPTPYFDCHQEGHVGRRPGLGDFPATLASPMNHAALALGDPHTLVVGATDPHDDARDGAVISLFSDSGAQVHAPGARVGGLVGGGANSQWHGGDGTSFAAPFVTGAAAYLLLLDPGLDNAALISRLTSIRAPLTDPRTRAVTTAPVLHLGAMVAASDVVLPGGRRVSALKLMADLDDGTPDGFSREPVSQPGGDKDYGAPRVDMRDFRAWRDAYHIKHGVPVACPGGVPACDLNGDTVTGVPPEMEPWPRAALTRAAVDDASLTLLQSVWDGDERQPVPAAELPAWVRSADLRIDAGAFMLRAASEGADAVLVTLGGEPLGGGPRPSGAGTRDLRVHAQPPAILTTPYLRGPSIAVQAVRGDAPIGRVYSAELPRDLNLSEDVPLVLNPCVWDKDDVGLLDAFTGVCDDDHDGPDATPFTPGTAAPGGAASWPSRRPGSHGASAHGDPHFQTWDGLFYDLQGVGEYVLVRSGGLEIQTRTAAIEGAGVSVNAAIAARVGADRVVFRRGEPDRVWINGAPRKIGGGVALAAGDLSRESGGVVLRWKGDDSLGVVIHADGIDAYVALAPTPGRTMGGLLGATPDGDPSNDLVGRDGAVFTAPDGRALHRVYGHGWRVTAGESLFDYGPGESTATFTALDFPPWQGTVADLSPAVYADAHARCTAAGVRQAALLEACILDTARLGRQSAAWSFRGLPDPRAVHVSADFRADFEAGAPPQFVYAADPASVLTPPITAAPGAAGWPATRFYGPFGVTARPEQMPLLALSDLPAHTAVAITFDVVALGEWRGDAGPVFEVLELHRPIVRTTYATTGTQAYPGSAPGGRYPAGTGAIAHDVLGLGERDTIFRHRVIVPHTDATLILRFMMNGAGPARWGLDNLAITTVELPASAREAVDFGGVLFQLIHGPAGEPARVGCADGTREAFHDASRSPRVAGCSAAWDDARDLRAAATGVACGEGKPCAAPADACARGWHVCGRDDVAELRAIDPVACLSAGVGQYLAARSVCADPGGRCSGDGATACLAEGPCSATVCCGSLCGRSDDVCDDGVWPGLTWSTAQACGAFRSNPLSGVLCCVDPS